ncbi:MAG: TraB/VirB10 family protein [Holosporaceae bacterium]|jgi:conjugal transfer pilus assembly protein TraB|nr:TraB/VirB10 family protein [Holosporaceae bacterium]
MREKFEKFVKAKQYKNFGFVAGGLMMTFLIMMAFRESKNSDNLKAARYYKKEIKTGVDGLSDQELWVEKSTNEIEDIRIHNKKLEDHNARLQKQLDSIQKLVIGLGVHLNAFDDQRESTAISSEDVPENRTYKGKSNSADQVLNSNESTPLLMDKIENFVDQRGVLGDENTSGISRAFSGERPNQKVLKNGIKVIRFSNTDSEYDLDENFIFAGTYARAVLVGTVIASAGIGASANPEPVLLRINDMGNLPNNVKGFLKDAIVIGAAYGDLSSESVIIRLERIVKIDNRTGVGIDIPVKGYVAAENGCSKIRGMVFDRAGEVARNAAVAGFMSGMADYLSSNSRSHVTFEPNSGLAQFSPQAGSKMLQQGASKGIGNAVEKYADFIIKRAEQMQPVIMIDGGRKVTIVFTDSVKASAVHMKKVRAGLAISGVRRSGAAWRIGNTITH